MEAASASALGAAGLRGGMLRHKRTPSSRTLDGLRRRELSIDDSVSRALTIWTRFAASVSGGEGGALAAGSPTSDAVGLPRERRRKTREKGKGKRKSSLK
ncbi:hypothetical protein GUJ93_ZPchr0006g45827 [Zizania palustris]|uniref:Uncharacterized protein n=1 Tax=Zizania palustris TaxID=103762 RepID=A0A8J5T643_ZIZPA|nr:hypothetical protein GUJ93_ZPchr0006g45827 [Zizania palustris]